MSVDKFKQPVDILDQWVACVNQHDLAGVLALYDQSATLLPTFSASLLSTPDALSSYFDNLLNNLSGSVQLQGAPHIQSIGEHVHALTGFYQFTARADGEVNSYAARYSFLVNQHLARPIIQHHSSLLPD